MSEEDGLSELVERAEDALDSAAIEVEVFELDPGPSGWVRNGQTSPLSRLVRCLRSHGVFDEARKSESASEAIVTVDEANRLPVRSVVLSVDHDTSYDDEHPSQPGVKTNRGWRFGDIHLADELTSDSRWIVLHRGPQRPESYVIDVTWRREPEPHFLITIPAIDARMQLVDDSPKVGREFQKTIRSHGRHMLAERLRLDPTDCPPSRMKYDTVSLNRLSGSI